MRDLANLGVIALFWLIHRLVDAIGFLWPLVLVLGAAGADAFRVWLLHYFWQ